MSWAGNNPYAALSAGDAIASQRNIEPKPRKNLANAKAATKGKPAGGNKKDDKKKKKPEASKAKAGKGNNSGHPGRPEKATDRKGRGYDRKPGTGRPIKESKRGGKDWGVDDAAVAADGKAEAAEGSNNKNKGGKREGGQRRRRDGDDEELTEEQLAELKAEREKEARQMTMEEWSKKKKGGAVEGVEFKTARKVDSSDFKGLNKVSSKQGSDDYVQFSSSSNNKKGGKGKKEAKGKNKKGEKLELGSAPRRRNNNNGGNRDGGSRDNNKGRNNNKNGGNRGGNNNRNNNRNKAQDLNLEDASAFPSLGGK